MLVSLSSSSHLLDSTSIPSDHPAIHRHHNRHWPVSECWHQQFNPSGGWAPNPTISPGGWNMQRIPPILCSTKHSHLCTIQTSPVKRIRYKYFDKDSVCIGTLPFLFTMINHPSGIPSEIKLIAKIFPRPLETLTWRGATWALTLQTPVPF